jgi:hypothetical protein
LFASVILELAIHMLQDQEEVSQRRHASRLAECEDLLDFFVDEDVLDRKYMPFALQALDVTLMGAASKTQGIWWLRLALGL